MGLSAALIVVAGAIAGCASKRSATAPTSGVQTTRTAVSAPKSSGTTPSGCPIPATTGASLSNRPTGVVAFSIYEKGKDPFPEGVFTDPSVSGVDVDIQWDTLESAQDTYDWSALDCMFAQANSHNKFVALDIIPGFGSPSWVLQLPGVQTQSFKFAYFDTDVEPRPLPLPWNEAYLQAWFTFLSAVAKRYGNIPEFRLIQVGGPTSVSTEMSLPDRTSGDTALPAAANGSDIAAWISLGYSPDKYVRAWQEAFDHYHQLFPNQYLGLALYPPLPIGANGVEDRRARTETLNRVIAAGMRFKQQFDLQSDGMKGNVQPSGREHDAVRDHCGDVVTGLRNSRSVTNHPQNGPLNRALDYVVAAGVDFWEVFAEDVDNPAMAETVKKASSELPAHKPCKH
jgi:hypothetical protein